MFPNNETVITMTEEELYVKKALCALGEELEKVEKRDYKGINIFKAAGVERQEVKHSAFAAWLLSPSEKHGLGNLFLKKFVEKLFAHGNRAEEDTPEILTNAQILAKAGLYSVSDAASFIEAKDIKTETEKVIIDKESRIDIFLSSRSARTVMVIENKVFTSTHDEQLTRYEKKEVGGIAEWKDWKKIFVYLTPHGDLPYELKADGSVEYNPSWCVFSYSTVLDIIGEIMSSPRGTVSNKLRYILEDYIEMVNNKILKTNADLRALCKKIRREHKEALDILMNYTDSIEDVVSFAEQQICASLDVEEVNKSSTKFEFIPLFIHEFFDDEPMELASGGYKALCRVSGAKGDIRAGLFLEKDTEAWSDRQKAIADAFGVSTGNKGKYCTLFNVTLVAEDDRGEEFEGDIKTAVENELNRLIAKLKEKQNKLV